MSSRALSLRLLAAVATASLLLPACGGDDGSGVRTIDESGSASGSSSGSAHSGSGSGVEESESEH